MIHRRALFLTAIVLVPAFGADPRWIRMHSTDFEVYSGASEGETRRVLQHLERVSDFFLQIMGVKPGKGVPVRVVVFGSKKEYEPYRPNQSVLAFYKPGPARDYIVFGGTSDDVFPIAVHEYVHLVVQSAGMKFPPWLNEGIAELYSTMKPAGDQVLVGTPVANRVLALQRAKWVPLSIILAADRDSPYYNEKNKVGSLYNEGWALTHMLALSRGYAHNFVQLSQMISNGAPSQEAIEKVYGKSLAEVEKDLRAYLQTGRFQAPLFPVKLRASSERATAGELSSFDREMAFYDLSDNTRNETESVRKLEELISQDPRHPDPHVALAYLKWRTQDQREAVAQFAKAIELGSTNPGVLYDYGRLAISTDPEGAMRALRRLLEDQPDRRDVRLALAEAQLLAKDATSARETLAPIRSVSAEDAPWFFRLMAYVTAEMGDRAEARNAARRWKENSKDDLNRTGADQFLSYLDSLERAGGTATRPNIIASATPFVARGDAGDGDGNGDRSPPAIRRAGPNLSSFSGVLTETRCEGGDMRVYLESSGERVLFLIQDPENISVTGLRDRTAVHLSCGEQKPVQVTVEYEPANPQTEFVGRIWKMDFKGEPEASAEASFPAQVQTTPPSRPFVSGMFTDFDCSSVPPRMILQVGKEKVAMLLDAVDRLLAYGLPDGKGIELSCGPQKPAAEVWVEYDPPSANQRRVKGLARAIHFEPPPSGLKTR
jgi:Tfp pilus assembly protein PilF